MKLFNISISKLQMQRGLSVSKKLFLNLFLLRKIRVRKISPFVRLTFKISLLEGVIKFKIFFLKIECERELQICESNLFHSTNDD